MWLEKISINLLQKVKLDCFKHMSEYIVLLSCNFVHMCINKINCIRFVIPFEFCINLSLNNLGYLSYFYYIRKHFFLDSILLLLKLCYKRNYL